MEMEKRLYPDKEIVPAGIFYCRLQDPLVEADSELTPAEIDHMILKKMRPDGLVNLVRMSSADWTDDWKRLPW